MSHEAGEALKNNTPLANPIRFEITRQPVLYNPSPVEIEGSALSWRKPQKKVFRKHDDLTQNINFNGFPAAGQSLYVSPTRSGLGITNKTIESPRQIQMSLSFKF